MPDNLTHHSNTNTTTRYSLLRSLTDIPLSPRQQSDQKRSRSRPQHKRATRLHKRYNFVKARRTWRGLVGEAKAWFSGLGKKHHDPYQQLELQDHEQKGQERPVRVVWWGDSQARHRQRREEQKSLKSGVSSRVNRSQEAPAEASQEPVENLTNFSSDGGARQRWQNGRPSQQGQGETYRDNASSGPVKKKKPFVRSWIRFFGLA